MPTIIDSDQKKTWLSDDLTINHIEDFTQQPSCVSLNITQVKDSLEYS